MKDIKTDLEWLLSNFVDPIYFPYVKNGNIYIGDYKIYYHNDFYVIKHINGIFESGRTYTKHGAFALAKSLVKKRNNREKILSYDKQVFHGNNDVAFLKHVLKTCNDSDYVKNISIRYYNTCESIDYAKDMLRKLI